MKEKIQKKNIAVPQQPEKKEQRSLFLAELRRSKTLSGSKRKKDKINVKVGDNIRKFISTESNFKCKFYICNLTDTEYRYMKTYDINTDKLSDCINTMNRKIKSFIFVKSALTSKGLPYREIPLNQLPNIKCDIQIYGKLFNDVSVFVHNYVNWDNSIEVVTKDALIDLISTLLFRLDYEVFKLQTQR